MLKDDKITSLAAHDKFLAVGTNRGYIYVMSHEGTMDHAHIPVSFSPVREKLMVVNVFIPIENKIFGFVP